MEYEAYFNRQIMLWGIERQESLGGKKIAIIGCGGLGSSLALALGCSGIGQITLVDFDTVSVHNIHRQIAFTLKDIKNNKAQVVSKLLKEKNPFLKTTAYEIDFAKFAIETKERFDLILDATDNFKTRVLIDKYAKDISTPWIYGSVEEFNGQVCFFEKAEFKSFNIKEHTPAGIATPIVMQIASIQANIAIRYLVGLPIEKDMLQYIYYDKNGALTIKKFKMPIKDKR